MVVGIVYECKRGAWIDILPRFFLQPQVPFYLNIQRLNQRTRLLYTSRAPSLLCEA